jgi:2,2-dialkylglycine decarboxylase (pyruvate)
VDADSWSASKLFDREESGAVNTPTRSPQRTTEDLLGAARRHLIRFHAAEDETPILCRGRGATVWDTSGVEYVDFVSGQICATIGHNHPRIISAIGTACAKQLHSNDFLLHDDSILLAEALAQLLPDSLSKFIFKSTGSEANEVAFAMAKLNTGGWEVVAPQRGFFGMTAATRSATHTWGHRGHGPGMVGSYAIPAPYAYRCPIQHCGGSCDCTCLDAGFELFDSQTDGYGAAVITEPIFSAGGLIDPPVEWFARLHAKARERGMLLILDESQTAPARLGAMFGFEDLGMVPDLLTFSKCIGGGLPLSVTATSPEIEERAFAQGFIMGSSHCNDPLAARVGLAVLEVLVEEQLVVRATRMGQRLRGALEELARRHELIGEIRGRGLLQGFELVMNRETTKEPAEGAGTAFWQACLERGLIANVIRMPGQHSVCRMAPPLTITIEELDRGVAIMDESLTVAAAPPR